jgi:hypothetical protein
VAAEGLADEDVFPCNEPLPKAGSAGSPPPEMLSEADSSSRSMSDSKGDSGDGLVRPLLLMLPALDTLDKLLARLRLRLGMRIDCPWPSCCCCCCCGWTGRKP